MPLFAQTFTRAGGDPDFGALATAIRPTISDPFYLGNSANTVTVVKPSVWTAPQITAVQASVTAAPAQTPQTDAQNEIDSMRIFEKAILLTINDELNLLRTATALATKTPAQMAALVRARAATL
jgi:hypothetical protein